LILPDTQYAIFGGIGQVGEKFQRILTLEATSNSPKRAKVENRVKFT
jgi:hypothetical protein